MTLIQQSTCIAGVQSRLGGNQAALRITHTFLHCRRAAALAGHHAHEPWARLTLGKPSPEQGQTPMRLLRADPK